MKNYIKSFRLLNFQSWSNASPEVEIDSDIINIIEGANETGKSVLYKVLYNMCFPGYWEPKELIRRGYETACMIITLTNGNTVIYELSRKHHSYYLISDGEDLSWTDCPLPERIINELGLILDMESNVILNVIDKDVPLPFIKTSPRFNASLIRAIVEPAKIADFFARTDEHLKDIDDARQKFKHQMETARESAAVLQYRNVDKLQEDKLEVDDMLALTEGLVPLIGQVSTMLTLYSERPDRVLDPSVVAGVVASYDAINATQASIDGYLSILSAKPSSIPSPTGADCFLSVYDSLQQVLSATIKASELIAGKPAEVCLPDIQGELCISSLVGGIIGAVTTAVGITADIACLKDQMDMLKREIMDIRERVGVCPTCGRLLEG